MVGEPARVDLVEGDGPGGILVEAGMVGDDMNPELTASEQALLEGIRFDPSAPDFHTVADANGRRVAALVQSMLARRAIPDVRWRYFTDPELNPGGRKSRQEVFIDNGCDRRAILTHPHFLKYLRYFIAGPQVPAAVRSRFEELATASMGDHEALRAFVRASVREGRAPRDEAAEEFFKLAVECGIDLRAAGLIRKDAMTAASSAMRSGGR